MIETTKTLTMNFKTAAGDKAAVNVADYRDDLTDDQVKTAMTTLVAKEVFAPNASLLATAESAQRVVKTVTDVVVSE